MHYSRQVGENWPGIAILRLGDDTRAASCPRFDCLGAAWPVRRAVPIIDPRSRNMCARGKLGEHLRWGTSLPDRLSELAIIATAQFWRAQYEWYAHAPLAEKAGVPAAAIEAIRRGETPNFEQKD